MIDSIMNKENIRQGISNIIDDYENGNIEDTAELIEVLTNYVDSKIDENRVVYKLIKSMEE